jgi:para-aminobenzoate synthetase component 2
MFAGMPEEFTAGRYHSLAVDAASVPSELRVTARAAGGTIMAIAHRHLPILGVQFHPESVLTEGGHRMLGNWLESIGLAGAQQRGARLVPHRPGA